MRLFRSILFSPFLFSAAGEGVGGGGGGSGSSSGAAPPAGGTAPPAGAAGSGAPAPAGTAPAAGQQGEDTEVRMPSSALARRLEEERGKARAALLKQHGFEKPDELAAKLKRLGDLENEKLTAEERTKKELADAQAAAATGKMAADTASQALDDLVATLSDTQRAALEEFSPAGSSVADRLRAVRMIRKLGGAAAPAGPPAAPASTSPAPGAPRPGGKTAYDTWADLSKKPGMAADVYYQTHKAAIEASRPAPNA